MGDVEELVTSEVDVISITCSDDDDDLISEELEDTKRDKFRLERQVKKEKVDNYPQYGGVITTILPISVTPAVPIPEARESVCPYNVNAALPKDRDTTSVMQHEASATDKVTDKVKPRSEAKKIINRKFFSEGQSNSGRCTVTKTVDRKHSNVRMEKRPLQRCRKQLMRNLSCLDRGEPSRGNQDLWERMQEMQYQNNQLTNLVENLYVKLKEKSNLEDVICTKARRYRQELSDQRPEVIINPVDDPMNQRDIYNEEKEDILQPQRRLHPYKSNVPRFPDQPCDIYQGRMVGLDEGTIPSVIPDQPEFTKLRERGVHARARFIQGSERGDRNWSDPSDREVPYRELYEEEKEEEEDATQQVFPRRSILERRAATDDLDKNRPAVPRCYRSPTINTSPVIQSQPLREWEGYRQDDLEDDRRAGYNYPSYSRENSYEIPDVHRGFVDRVMDGSQWQNSQRRVVYGGEMAVHDLISDHPYHALAGINRMVHHQGPVRQQERHHWGSERQVVDIPHRLIHERQLAQRVGRRILSRQQAFQLQGPTQLQETRSVMMENRIRSLRNQGEKHNRDGYWRRKHLIAQNEYARRYDLEDHPELVQCQGTMRNF